MSFLDLREAGAPAGSSDGFAAGERCRPLPCLILACFRSAAGLEALGTVGAASRRTACARSGTLGETGLEDVDASGNLCILSSTSVESVKSPSPSSCGVSSENPPFRRSGLSPEVSGLTRPSRT